MFKVMMKLTKSIHYFCASECLKAIAPIHPSENFHAEKSTFKQMYFSSHLAPKPKSPFLCALRAHKNGLLGFSMVKVQDVSQPN